MAQSAREKFSRRSWLLAGLTVPLFRARAASALTVSFDGDNLHVAAPQLHFLTGKPLSRLMDGSSVVFFSQLTIFRDDRGTVYRRAPERLTVSYDVWEEKFKVVMAIYPRTASRLSMAAAETWCLENLAISALGLEPDRPFWMRFDLRAADEREVASVVGDPGISIRGLIERLGRKPGAGELHWMLPAGPLRLADLPRTAARGNRG
jgi:hypothetical protein